LEGERLPDFGTEIWECSNLETENPVAIRAIWHLKLPVDLLLSKLPHPTAIAILSFQREKAAIPELKELATRDGMIGLMAKEALEAISNPPGNAQEQ
jgi:hypothetical protein